MKKLLSILLALVMVFSLTAPALAAAPDNDLDPPLWRIWGYDSYEDMTDSEYSYWTEERYAEALANILAFMEANPAQTAQFRANAYTFYEEKYAGDWGTPQEFMTEWNETEEQFLTDMTVCQIWANLSAQEYVDAWAAQCAEQPERTAQFLAELPTWFAEEYYYYDSFDEYVEYRTCKEEAYLELFSDWNWLYTLQQEAEQAKRDFITAHGGVPGQINVMVNGKCVKFTDAAPEVAEGRTMVPFRAIFETLGAEISYEDGTIHAVLGDMALDLTIGSDTMTKTADGKTETVKMDCAPYVKGGRTYVPVRFIGEALGCDVQWDGYYNTAVITDLDALAEQIDKDFTIYNKLAAKSALTDKTQKSVGSGRADVTLFDTLNGDKTGKATYSYDLAASTAGASGKLEYDFSELWALIEGYIPMPLTDGTLLDPNADEYAEEYAQALEMVKSLMKGTLDVRVDLKKGKVYVSMPGLFEAMESYLEESGVQLPKDAWLSTSLGDGAELDELIGMLGQTTTIGKLLTATAGSAYFPAKNYDFILEAAEAFGKLYGDAKFKRQGSAYVLTLTKEDLVALAGDDSYAAGELDALSKFEYSLTVKDNGDVDVSAQCNVALSGDGLNLGDMVAISSKGSTRGGKTEATMEFHIKNVLKATVTIQETVSQTEKAPETTPPSDVLVLPLDGTLPGGTITSPDGPTQSQQ